jgi:hypothetical protein
MTDDVDAKDLTLSSLTVKAVVVHTVTYFLAGLLAYTLGGYEKTFSEPPLSYFMRPTTDRLVMAGPLFQPIRGVIFAVALYPLRRVLFAEKRGWLILWWLLLALGVLSTFGPAPGSVEGMIYTVIPPLNQVLGLWEVLLQSFLFSLILFHWVNHAEKRWLSWALGIVFCVVMTLPLMGLLSSSSSDMRRSSSSMKRSSRGSQAHDAAAVTYPTRRQITDWSTWI